MKTLNIDNNKGLLFPEATGVSGAVRIGEVYYEVINSSYTTEGTNNTKTLNATVRKLGGRKSVDLHITRSPFTQEKAPKFISNEFVVDGVDYQVVGWTAVSKTTNKSLISLAVNEVKNYDFDL